MKKIQIKTDNAQQTISLGQTLARHMRGGSGALLTGELGAGKTTIISGICRGLGVTDKVKSPTFLLEWQYKGDYNIHHVDLYRLGDYEELENIGWEEMTGENEVYLVEWANRFFLPYTDKALKIQMDYGPAITERVIEIQFDENQYPKLEDALKRYENIGN